jgi:hypothetical protein
MCSNLQNISVVLGASLVSLKDLRLFVKGLETWQKLNFVGQDLTCVFKGSSKSLDKRTFLYLFEFLLKNQALYPGNHIP